MTLFRLSARTNGLTRRSFGSPCQRWSWSSWTLHYRSTPDHFNHQAQGQCLQAQGTHTVTVHSNSKTGSAQGRLRQVTGMRHFYLNDSHADCMPFVGPWTVFFRNFGTSRPMADQAQEKEHDDTVKNFRGVMRKVPQPVVVVTTAHYDEQTKTWIKRGITCSSFTSISLQPPIVSFAVTIKSRMHALLEQSKQFAVHVLANNQVNLGFHFSKPAIDGVDQFHNIPHEDNNGNIPVLRNACSVMKCHKHSVTTMGDHHVWYGNVYYAYKNGHGQEPLLFYARSFRSIGDETFMQAFEETSLPFEDWTHEAHLRMAYNYILEHGREGSIKYIKAGIHRYNEQHMGRLQRGYHETVTMFYIYQVAKAIKDTQKLQQDLTFEEFLACNQFLTNKDLLFEYYSDEKINYRNATKTFILPDKKPLPE